MSTKPMSGVDDATFIFFLFLVAACAAALTSVSFIIAAVVLTLAWFFGSPKRTAFVAAGAAAISAGMEVLIPGMAAFINNALTAYGAALSRSHYLLALEVEWLRFAVKPEAWLRLMPLGLLLGAATILLLESRKNSAGQTVFGSKTGVQPSPWARILVPRVLKGTALHRGAIVLGADEWTGKRIGVTRAQLNLHTMIVGRTGRGKTESVLTLCAGAVELGIPVFYVDGKGDAAVQRALQNIAAKNNKPFYAFDSTNPIASCAWDALADMNATTQANTVVALRSFWSEPHYKAKADKFSLTVCRVLRHVGMRVDLFSFRDALSVDSLISALRRNARKNDVDGRALMTEVAGLRGIESEAVDSLRSEVESLTDTVFGYLFDIGRAEREGRPILRLLQARKEGAIVYIGLPALEYTQTAPKAGALAISVLKAVLPALDREHVRSTTPLPLTVKQFFCVFDEWSVFAGDHVLNVVNMGRSFGGSCCLAAQSYADFEIDGRDRLLRQVAGSTATFIVHELNDPKDAEYAAALFGTKDAVEYTAQTVSGTPTGAESARGTKEFAVHPDEIKNLGVGEAFYMNKNQKNRKTKKSIVHLIKVRRHTS